MTDVDSGSSPAIEALLDAALAQFGLYGFSKTTMTDIAKASGVSRTSLYNHFPTKEDVFQAISNRLNERVFDAVVSALNIGGTPEKRMLAVMHARVSWVYELLHASSFGRELIDEKNRICGGQILAANDRFSNIVTDILMEYSHPIGSAEALSSVLIQSVNGVLEHTTSKQEAEASVEILVSVFCSGLSKR